MNRPVKIPDASHAIRIVPGASPIVVTVAGKVIADTARALVLSEASYRPVIYIPRRDVDMALLAHSARTTYCPYKGDATYYSIPVGGHRSVNAAWSYEAPFAPVAAIRGYLAFYPDRVDSIVEWPGEWGLPLPGHDLALGPVQRAG
jgi:uncharacterized protein (DUF427 family)